MGCSILEHSPPGVSFMTWGEWFPPPRPASTPPASPRHLQGCQAPQAAQAPENKRGEFLLFSTDFRTLRPWVWRESETYAFPWNFLWQQTQPLPCCSLGLSRTRPDAHQACPGLPQVAAQMSPPDPRPPHALPYLLLPQRTCRLPLSCWLLFRSDLPSLEGASDSGGPCDPVLCGAGHEGGPRMGEGVSTALGFNVRPLIWGCHCPQSLALLADSCSP